MAEPPFLKEALQMVREKLRDKREKLPAQKEKLRAEDITTTVKLQVANAMVGINERLDSIEERLKRIEEHWGSNLESDARAGALGGLASPSQGTPHHLSTLPTSKMKYPKVLVQRG
jgi:hypothetical protein